MNYGHFQVEPQRREAREEVFLLVCHDSGRRLRIITDQALRAMAQYNRGRCDLMTLFTMLGWDQANQLRLYEKGLKRGLFYALKGRF